MSRKKTTDFALYLRLLRCVAPYKGVFAIAVLALAALALTNPAIAALFKNITEGVFLQTGVNLFTSVVVPALVIFLVAAISSYVSRYALAWVAERLVADLRLQMFQVLLRLPCAELDRRTGASLISRFTFDVTRLKQAGASAVTTLGRDTLSIIGLVAWMAIINGWMTLIALVAGPFILMILLVLRRRLRRVSRLLQDSAAGLHHVLDEVIAGHRIIRIFAGREQESGKFVQRAEADRRYNMKFAAAAAAGAPAINIVTILALLVIVYVAAGQAAAGSMSVAEFNSFFAALLMLLSPLRRLSRVNEDLQKGLAASESVFAFLDQDTEPDSGRARIDRLRGAIEMRNLSFDYGTNGGPVLRDVSLSIAPGECVAIVGPSGSGKTSLVNLLPRFYEASGGELLLDGHNIRELPLNCLRANIALVSQDPFLYNDTVRNNIACGAHADASLAQVREAAHLADALAFIESLENGFDTLVGNNGARLSGGQRQRVALARAILKDAPILILDEPTAALDPESECVIQQALNSIRRERTCIIISHRHSVAQAADRVLTLENGTITQAGMTVDEQVA